MHEYSDTQKERKRERKTSNTKNTRPETAFSKEKAALRWDSNPRLMFSRHDALPTELLRQLSWLRSLIQIKVKQAKQGEHLNLINR